MRWFSAIHFAVFSVGTPTASASTSAAAADGASPTTDPAPCSASHAARTVAIVVDFPVPAGPTSTSRHRPEVMMAATAVACSAASTWPIPGATIRPSWAVTYWPTAGPSVARPASRSRASASRTSWLA